MMARWRDDDPEVEVAEATGAEDAAAAVHAGAEAADRDARHRVIATNRNAPAGAAGGASTTSRPPPASPRRTRRLRHQSAPPS
jgi:hypothetical protein